MVASKQRTAQKALISRRTLRDAFNDLRRDVLSVVLLIATTLVLVSMVVWFNSNYAGFPDLMPLHFDAQGVPDRIGERGELSVLLTIAVVVYSVNMISGLALRLLARMSFAPYLLWSGALLVELLLWYALWNVTR